MSPFLCLLLWIIAHKTAVLRCAMRAHHVSRSLACYASGSIEQGRMHAQLARSIQRPWTQHPAKGTL